MTGGSTSFRLGAVLAGAVLMLVAVLAVGLPLAQAGPRRQGGLVRIGQAPVLPAGTLPLAAAAASQRLAVTVALAPRDPRALSAYAAAVADPRSPDYRHFLSTAAFATRFGPSAAAITAVRRTMARQGLDLDRLQANHLSLTARAPAATLERSLHLRLAHVLLPSGRSALVDLEAPAVPTAIAGDVQAVVGLDGLATMRSLRRADSARQPSGARHGPERGRTSVRPRATKHQPAACGTAQSTASSEGAYTANQIAGAYGFSGLYAAGDEGAGVTIGVYELEPNSPSDIAAYQSCYGTAAPVSYRSVDGGAGSGNGSGEAAFDIEQLIGLAPKASLIVYQAPNSNSDSPGSGPYDLFSTMISQDAVKVISNSWGECEAVEGAANAHAENTLFEEAAIQGQTVVSAAGDDGSEDCRSAGAVPNNSLAVDDPGSQPFVTDVGGTSMTAPGPPPTEVVWNGGGSALSSFGSGAGAGGGGISTIWGMPSYQADAPAGLGVLNPNSSGAPCGAGSGACREVPDVAADADPSHGYLIYYNGNGAETGQPQGWQSSGGTSGAAPLWAALFALTDADSACEGEPVGFTNPALYSLAAGGEGSDFHDVTVGDNDFTDSHGGLYPAAAGYDMATGLGSPNAAALAAGLCADSLRLGLPASEEVFTRERVNLTVRTAGGGQPVTVSVTGLPRGVGFSAATGTISGVARLPGLSVVHVTATDSAEAVRRGAFLLLIAARPSLSHLRVSGLRGRRATLSVRLAAGRSEAKLGLITLTLPNGLGIRNRHDIVVRSPAGGRAFPHRLTVRGRRVTLTLSPAQSPVYVNFAPGALTVGTGLRRAAGRRQPSPLTLDAVVQDTAGQALGLRASARPAN